MFTVLVFFGFSRMHLVSKKNRSEEKEVERGGHAEHLIYSSWVTSPLIIKRTASRHFECICTVDIVEDHPANRATAV